MDTKSQNNELKNGKSKTEIIHEHYRHFLKVKKEFTYIVPWAMHGDSEEEIETRKKRIEKLNKEHQSVRRAF